MEPTSIPQRELRNASGRVLREVADGREFVVTVRGRPVAKLSPITSAPEPASRQFVPFEDAIEIIRQCHPDPHQRPEIGELFNDTWRY